MAYLNVLLPVYNEQLRLEAGVRGTIEYFDDIGEEDYELTIVDNASVDETQAIAERLCEEFSNVHYIRLHEKGVGVAFRAGVAANKSPIVGYMDIDLSTDVKHLLDMLRVFREKPEVGMLNASRWNRSADTRGRKWYRNITSHGLTWLLKLALQMKASDAICGFKFFRKDVVEALIEKADSSENGWFYIIELLLRAERAGYVVYELPVHWEDDYRSTVNVRKVVWNYCTHIVKLRKAFGRERRADK